MECSPVSSCSWDEVLKKGESGAAIKRDSSHHVSIYYSILPTYFFCTVT
jgi:hypothetical protein